MDDQQRLVEQIFGAALERAAEERDAFLDHACEARPQIRQRVQELLLEDEGAGSFLKQPLVRLNGWQDQTQTSNGLVANAWSKKVVEEQPSARFAAGQVIAGRFTVVRFLEHGGMGEVYEAEDRFLQHVHIALKVILPAIAADAGASERFEQEVLLARKVTHPNLCPIYDISFCEDPAPPFLFLTMKLLQGETLATRLRSVKPVSRADAVAIFRQMIAGVGAIHAAGVVHRDIKPNNVMLDDSSGELRVSIMDFGLARLHESETTIATRGLVAGTPGYIAPELYRGHRPSQASDLYALGVLLHQVFTGGLPASRADGLAAQPSSALAVANVPRTMVHAVEGLLSEDPKRRCDAFEKLQGEIDGRGVRARIERGPLLTRRRFLIGSAVAACGVTGGAVALGPEWVDRWMHPLPRKRFVALLSWPTVDAKLKPMLLGVIDAIAGELSRAEVFDHDLLVLAQPASSDLTTQAQLNEARESLGANLVLAAFATPAEKDIHLSLRVLDPSSTEPLRQKDIRVAFDQQALLPEKAIRAAARLLDIADYDASEQRARPGTTSPAALAAFQGAEASAVELNDTGLDVAIERYKQAVELDPHYAEAYARLARAYERLYVLHGDAGAIALARANSRSALREDPNSVEGHLALAWIGQQTGDRETASREIQKALSLDPSNPKTLIYQADFYAAMGEWSHAEVTLNRVLAMRPNFWLPHNQLGVVLDSQGKYTQALMAFRSASLAAPKSALAFSNLGDVYLKLGQWEQALLNAQKSYALNPNEAAATTLAAIFRGQRDYPNAIAYALKATRLAPTEAVDWLELGDCYAAAHKPEAAAAYARADQVQEEQLRTEPKNGPEWMLLALCRVKANRGDTAASLVARADSLQADDIDSQIYKARALELLGRRVEAASVIKRCVQRGVTEFQLALTPDIQGLRVNLGRQTVSDSSYPLATNAS